ncbi:MAG: hypothetical protein E7411_00845 [Ruminococcaceae bacterium]|nr:hypothetical protein [Oscillospiraceae bacterium]
MYQTYTGEECSEKREEKLIPKEVVCEPKAPSENAKKGLFGGLDNDDILILGLLLILMLEDCKDNMLIIILVALLFIN